MPCAPSRLLSVMMICVSRAHNDASKNGREFRETGSSDLPLDFTVTAAQTRILLHAAYPAYTLHYLLFSGRVCQVWSSALAQTATLQTCIREVSGSSLGQDTSYTDEGFSPQILQAYCMTVPQIRPRPLLSMFFFSIYYSFSSVHSTPCSLEWLIASLSILQNKV
jgi:hypothetical protein